MGHAAFIMSLAIVRRLAMVGGVLELGGVEHSWADMQ